MHRHTPTHSKHQLNEIEAIEWFYYNPVNLDVLFDDALYTTNDKIQMDALNHSINHSILTLLSRLNLPICMK